MALFVPCSTAFDDAIKNPLSARYLKLLIDTDGDGDLEDVTSYLDNNQVIGGGKGQGELGVSTKEYSARLRNSALGLADGAWAGRVCAIEAKAGTAEYIRIFTGFVSEEGAQRVKISVTEDLVDFTMQDASCSRGMRRKTKPVNYVNYKICDTAAPATSLFHKLAYQLGLADADLETATINQTKDYLPLDGEREAWQELQDLCAQYIGHMTFRYDGKLRLISRHQQGWTEPASEWTFDADNVYGWRGQSAGISCNRCRTEFERYENLGPRTIYKNTDEWDAANRRNNIVVGAGGYWPGPYAEDKAQLQYKDPDSGEEWPVGISIVTPTIGTVGSGCDIECEGGLLTLISFNGSTSATQQNPDSSEIILRNNTGGTVTVRKLEIRGTAIRIRAEVTVEDVDGTVSDDWKFVDRTLPGKYAVSDTQAHVSTQRWVEFGKVERKEFEFATYWLPQIQEGAVVTFHPCESINISAVVEAYKHDCAGSPRKWRTQIAIREKESFTPSGSPKVITQATGEAATEKADATAEDIADRPTYTEVQEGYTQGGGTKTPTVPEIILCKCSSYRSITIGVDIQDNLTNFDRNEFRVSANQTDWYSLRFDGVDWKDQLGGVTPWPGQSILHTLIPLGGTVEAPTAVTLYYQARRVTKAEVASGWSATASATVSPVASGDLAAAAVKFSKMSGGYGLNMLPNGDFSVIESGIPKDWSNYAPSGWGATWGVNLNPAWSLMGNLDAFNRLYANTPYMWQPNRIGDDSYGYWISPYIPVVVGSRYCASVYSGAHRAQVRIQIDWYNEALTYLSSSSLGDPYNNEAASGGPTLAGYKRVYTYGDAPAGATRAVVVIIKWDTKAGQPDSWAFICRAAFEQIGANATEPGMWMPPATNIVTAGMLVAGAVVAGKIAAGAVDTDQLAAEAVTAAKIETDTITANKLKASEIATMLLLATSAVIIGQDYAGTPPAGAQRVVVDDNEFKLEEWDGTQWVTILRLGGDDMLKWYLSCRGVIKTGADISGLPVGDKAPAGSKIFDFEDDYQDQAGSDPWDVKDGTRSFTTGKFSKGLTGNVGSIQDSDAGGADWGASFGVDAWLKLTAVSPPSPLELLRIGSPTQAPFAMKTPASYGGSQPVQARLSASDFVVAYGSAKLYAKIGQVAADGSITYGSEYEALGANVYQLDVHELTSTKFALVYRKASDNYAYAKIGTVSGTAITFGAEAKFSGTDVVAQVRVSRLSDTKLVAGYYTTTGPYVKCAIGDESGGSITFGSVYSVGEISTWFGLDGVSSTLFVIGYCQQSLTKVRTASVSGTTITYNTAVQAAAAGAYDVGVCALSSAKFAMTRSTGTLYTRTGTISGTAITLGGEQTLKTGSITDQDCVRCHASEDGRYAVAWFDTGDDKHQCCLVIAGSDNNVSPSLVTDLWTGTDITACIVMLSTYKGVTAYDNNSCVSVWTKETSVTLRLDGTSLKFNFVNRENSVDLSDYFGVSAGWYHVSVNWNYSTKTLYYTVNGYSASRYLGSYTLDPEAPWLTLTLQSSTYANVWDDLLVLADALLDPSTDSIAHFAAGIPWADPATGVDALLDLILLAKAGGQIKTLSSLVPLGGLDWPTLHVREEQTSGTHGGGSVSGAWYKRTLNTTLKNTISGASLSSSEMILPAGTYSIQARVPMRASGPSKAKLYNVSDSTDILIGSQAASNVSYFGDSDVWVQGEFTLAAQKNVAIYYRCTASRATEGLGYACSFGVVEVYTEAIIRKVA